jgi:hypothetical protein
VTEPEKEQRKRHYLELAEVVANGDPINQWAKSRGVRERTAYNWANSRKVTSQVDAIRRRFIDEAVGKMTRQLGWATDRIRDLGDNASSESVQLSAAKSYFTNVVTMSKFSVLEHRLADLEEEFLDHNGSTVRPA